MRSLWIYDFPSPLLGALILGLFVGVAVGGYYLTRRHIHRLPMPANDLVGHVYGGIGVIYAVLLAMIAIGSWDTFAQTRHEADREASACLQLYRDLGAYPSPFREARRAELRTYLQDVIKEEWPQFKLYQPAGATNPKIEAMVLGWASFEPTTTGMALFHQATLSELDDFLEARRMRILLGQTGIPNVMWCVILIGAFITIGFTYFFWTENTPLHLLTIAALGSMTGLMVFLILMLDHPLQGPLTIRPDSFEQVQRIIEGIQSPP